MSKKGVRYILPTLVLFMLAACEVKYPEDIIQPDKMEALLYDYHLAQTMSTEVTGDEYKRKLYAEYVFDKHNVTKEEFDSSMVWYTRNPKHLYDIYSSLEERLTAEVEQAPGAGTQNRAAAQSDTIGLEGDIVNLWQGQPLSLLSATPLMNRITYSYAADSTYHTGDSLVMQMNVHLIAPQKANVRQTAHAAMVVEYDDSTFCNAGNRIEASGRYSIAVPRNYDKRIKAVRGYIYYGDNNPQARAKMLIDQLKVLRIHPEVDEDAE